MAVAILQANANVIIALDHLAGGLRKTRFIDVERGTLVAPISPETSAIRAISTYPRQPRVNCWTKEGAGVSVMESAHSPAK
ncbi:MAG: hypothetical protein M0D54_05975 [Hyphomonadaceae bacterium JAD_PAG50586_4]|nr:MAG: hypothetical protein M0D54_05975 [Hyphomonadaceae bacterium JAD_PAG50586_4]